MYIVQDNLEKLDFLKGMAGGQIYYHLPPPLFNILPLEQNRHGQGGGAEKCFFYLLSVCPHESFFFLQWQNRTIKNFIRGTYAPFSLHNQGQMPLLILYAVHDSLFREIGKLCLLELKLECFL